MRKNLLLALAAGLITISSANATIRRVSNSTNTTAPYNSLQTAHNAAASGDTIQVEGSTSYYAGFTATKKVVVIGPGYFLTENTNLQASTLPANVGSIDFSTGSAGSSVMGLNFNNSSHYVRVSNITFRRNNQFSVYLIGTISDITIAQNYQVGSIGAMNSPSYPYNAIYFNVTGLTITNNHCYSGTISLSETTALNPLIQNNVFDGTTLTVNGAFMMNNILVNGSFYGYYNTIYNNCCNSSQFVSTNNPNNTYSNNLVNQTLANIFQGSTGNTTDGQWRLKTGSPAIGTGTNGVDMGMYGNGNPYVLSGIPPVPTVYFNNTPVSGTTTAPLNVTVKVRSNN